MNNMLSQSQVQEDGFVAVVENTTARPVGGFTGLGYTDEISHVWSKSLLRVVSMTPSMYTERILKAMFGAAWCNEHYTVYPDEGEPYFDSKYMADDIQEACQAKGRYCPAQERKAGIWRGADGELVVSSAADVWRDDGTKVQRDGTSGFLYPVDDGIDLDPTDEPATPAEVSEFEKAYDSWEWNNPSAPALITAWVVVSAFSGALSARPHLWMTAPAGMGKSLASRQLGATFGTGCARPVGSLTQAGILQKLRGRAIPCIIDESEAGPTGRKSVQAALDVARWSYSMSEYDDGVLRGTAGGKALGYRAFSPFAFLGINPPKLGHADQSRTVVLEMKRQKRSNGCTLHRLLRDESYARKQGRKLRRLAVSRYPVFERVLPKFRDTIVRQGGATRTADTLGTLLAGYWCVKSTADPSPDDLDTLVSCLDLEAQIEAHAESDEVRCADLLYYSKVGVPVVEPLGETTRTMTMAEAIRLYCVAPESQHRLGTALQSFGVRLLNDAGRWQVAVVCSDSHRELQRIFAGSAWSRGGWALMLRRLPGGTKATKRVAGRTCKVSLFDVPGELLPDAGNVV